MSTIQEKLAHTATLAKWKLDQQIRLNTSQTKEKQLQSQIVAEKMRLAEETFSLFRSEELIEENLKGICANIVEILNALDDQKNITESIKVEQPPTVDVVTDGKTQVGQTARTSGGLICPECKSAIPVKFCPKCGREGVPM